jgi:tetratricopeptide (TPR) repeat protein
MYATTEYYRRATMWLQASYRPEVLGVYFELVDACSHLFMENAPPRRAGTADADDQAFADTVDRCYAYQDEVLADIVSLADGDTLIIVCSDHGFKSGERRPDTPGRAADGQAALWHLPNGIVLLRGRAVTHGSTVRDATVLDITPTVLRELDVPLAHDLAGKPIPEAFGAGRSMSSPAKIARYDFVPVPPPQPGAAAAPEKVAELRALGYLTGSSDAPRRTDGGRFAASFVNEGVALYVDREYRDALHAFEKAVELDQRNVNARAFAARIQLERRELGAARQLLDQAAALDPRSAYVRLLRANLAITARDWEAADRELAAAAALDARLPMLYLQRARLQNARHDPAAALASLDSAERLTDAEPMLLDILILRADAFTVLGRFTDAAAALTRAAELAPPDHVASARADVALARGDSASAIGYLRRALDRSPKAAHLWAVLGATYGEAGDYEAAIDAYQRSVAIEPTALACKTLAALLFEIRHDRARARELWEQSLALDRRQPDVQRFLSQYDFSR